MNQTLILGEKVLMVGPKVALIIATQIHHLTLRVGFIWYVCFNSPFHLQPFFGVIIPLWCRFTQDLSTNFCIVVVVMHFPICLCHVLPLLPLIASISVFWSLDFKELDCNQWLFFVTNFGVFFGAKIKHFCEI
jgi:hypothetical protein